MITHKSFYQLVCLAKIACLALVAWGCTGTVITTKDHTLSTGSLNFILAAFFTDELDVIPVDFDLPQDRKVKDVSTPSPAHKALARIENRLRDLYTAGSLADKYGFREHEFHDQYVFIQKRGRESRAAALYFKRHLGEEHDFEEKLNLLSIDISPRKMNDIIESQIVRKGAEIVTRDAIEDIIIGKNRGSPVTLGDISRYNSHEEFSRLLAFRKEARPAAITEAVRGYVNAVAHDRMLSEMNADLDEIAVFDHNRAAELYLSARFGKAGKGVYPVGTLELSFSPTELYDHYFEILPTLTQMKYITVEGGIFHTEKMAGKFQNALQENYNLQRLCAELSNYRCPAFWKIEGYNNPMDLAEREERTQLENTFLRAALRSDPVPGPFEFNGRWVAGKITQITFADQNPAFEKYSWAVKRDLTVKSLNRLLESEMNRTSREIGFEINKKQFYAALRELAGQIKRE